MMNKHQYSIEIEHIILEKNDEPLRISIKTLIFSAIFSFKILMKKTNS